MLRRGIAGGVLLLSAGSFARAGAAAVVPDGDVAYLRLLIATELLKVDFQARSIASGKLARSFVQTLRKMRADDRAHYRSLAVLTNAAAQTPTTAADIDFSYPRATFDSQASIARLASSLASLTLGAYLGAVESVETPRLRMTFAQIAANEAQQLSALSPVLGRPVIGHAFGAALPIEAVSSALDAFES